jgi:hypothetical protein
MNRWSPGGKARPSRGARPGRFADLPGRSAATSWTRLTRGKRVGVYGRLMGRHDPDPRERSRYLLTALIVLVLIALVVLGASELYALG